MTGSTSAGSDSKDDGLGGGSAPSEGSQGDGGKGSGDMVPKHQFLAALKSAEEKRVAETNALRQEMANLRAAVEAKGPPAAKPPTRAEMQTLVESGDITQAQADAAWEKQVEEKAQRTAAAEVERQMRAQQHTSRITAELQGYRELVPDVWNAAGSEDRLKVEKEYHHLISLGATAGQETEAAALRAAFGDLETLRAARSSRPGPADTHLETGSGRKPSDGGGGKDKDVVKDLTARERQFYEDKIRQGIYPNWDAVREERKFARSREAKA